MIVSCLRCNKPLDTSEFKAFSYHTVSCQDTGDIRTITRWLEYQNVVDVELVSEWIGNQQGEITMSNLDEFLRGIKPEINDEFEVMKGVYKTIIRGLDPQVSTRTGENQYLLTLEVFEIMDGNGSTGRRFWKRYGKNEEGLKALLDDLFTAGITVETSSVEAMEASFEQVLSKIVYLRAWGWTPDKDRNGQPLEPADQRTYQQFVIVSEKRVSRLVERSQAATIF